MFRLAHISDPHLGPMPSASFRQLASKRLLGYINWHRHRAGRLTDDVLRNLLHAIASAKPDHVAVTGDLVNIALPEELPAARRFLEMIGSPQDVTAIPGNHDAYVPGAVARASIEWAPFLKGDADGATPTWPSRRIREDVALIGVNTARASAPFMATGHVSSGQAARLEQYLREAGEAGLFRVLMIHHPPVKGSTAWHKRLIGASRIRNILARVGAELVLHGHTHAATEYELPGPRRPIPVISVPSASQRPGGSRPAAGFNLFDIEKSGNGWQVEWVENRTNDNGEGFYPARGRTWQATSNLR